MKKWGIIFAVFLFTVGMFIIFYPAISNIVNSFTQSKVINEYNSAVRNGSEKEYEKIFSDAQEYNRKLRELRYPLNNCDEICGYDQLLNINGDGMMGYIVIEKIKLKLPIYHGTSEDTLSVACGHLKGTSLPVGGPGTHSLLTAHSGIVKARLFNDLYRLEVGDIFKIIILNKKFRYRVDRILTVKPDEVEYIAIDDSKDYCTLATCTPYGINSHRLLVRGERIE